MALERLERDEEAIDQWLAASDPDRAGAHMAAVAPLLVAQGRLGQIGIWLDRLPDAVAACLPELLQARGDAARLLSRFDEAVGWYGRAADAAKDQPAIRSLALAGKAQVYLDTLRPGDAEALLAEALVLAPDASSRADLLRMQAENSLNRGDTATADALLSRAGPAGPEHAGRSDAPRCAQGQRLRPAPGGRCLAGCLDLRASAG